MNTRPGVIASMTQEEREKLIADLERRGARISIHDPRLTGLQNWILAAIGSLGIGVGAWLASNVAELNKSVAVLIQQNQFQQAINQNQDNRLSIYDDRLRAVEREFYQGGSDARRR